MAKYDQLMALEELVEINEELFYKEFNKHTDLTSSAPGRINIIGDHTDYNFGLAIPAAINRWVIISFCIRNDDKITIESINYEEEYNLNIHDRNLPKENWKKYCFGALSVFKEKKNITHGFDALIWGNVPLNAGISSSAALEVAFMNGLRSLYSSSHTDLEIVQACQQIEHQYLQVNSGLLDQYASMFSRKDHIMVLDFATLQHNYFPIDMKDYEWVLVDSGITRELARSSYSERVKETSEAFEYLKNSLPHVEKIRDIKEDQLDLLSNEVWKKRIGHYISENRRVVAARDTILKQDYNSLGKLLNRSHQSLRDLYEVSCLELDFLANQGQHFRHCLGSRMMGGGFGGCTINLVQKGTIDEFREFIQAGYKDKFNRSATVETYYLADGAKIHF